MTTLVPGLLVGKNVRLVRALAQGGMGAVWVADHLGLGTQVAVKFMTEEVAQNAQSVQRFTSEATAAARIKSPHVVQVFDHGIADFGMPYIVMELLDGEDLAKHVERLGPMSLTETAKVIAQTCTALAKAHSLGIIHRDIKPENIFLTDSGGEMFVKVLDFGIAKQRGDVAHGVTSTGVVVGTPSYMSPEQVLSAKHLDHRADLWSVGVVAYHCLTAQVPFHGESFGALAVAIHTCIFSPPSSLRRDLPPAVDAWLARVLAREPDGRFGSAKEMSDAFAAAIVADRGSSSRGQPAWAPTVAMPSTPYPSAAGGYPAQSGGQSSQPQGYGSGGYPAQSGGQSSQPQGYGSGGYPAPAGMQPGGQQGYGSGGYPASSGAQLQPPSSGQSGNRPPATYLGTVQSGPAGAPQRPPTFDGASVSNHGAQGRASKTAAIAVAVAGVVLGGGLVTYLISSRSHPKVELSGQASQASATSQAAALPGGSASPVPAVAVTSAGALPVEVTPAPTPAPVVTAPPATATTLSGKKPVGQGHLPPPSPPPGPTIIVVPVPVPSPSPSPPPPPQPTQKVPDRGF